MIKIKTEKIILRGIKKIKVLEIEALRDSDLPQRYLNHPDALSYMSIFGGNSYFYSQKNFRLLTVSDVYDIDDFAIRIEKIKLAASILEDINAILQIENVDWSGEYTYHI